MTLLDIFCMGYDVHQIIHEKKTWLFNHLKSNGIYLAQDFSVSGPLLFTQPVIVGILKKPE